MGEGEGGGGNYHEKHATTYSQTNPDTHPKREMG